MAAQDDDTIRLTPVRPASGQVQAAPQPSLRTPTRRGVLVPALLVGMVAALGGGGAWWWLRPGEAPPALPLPPTAVPSAAPRIAVSPVPIAPEPPSLADRLASLPPLLDEAAIRAHRAAQPTLLRYAGNPAVFVMDFPTLEAQGAALNRFAALVEKAGMPRERVLNEVEMADAIARNGDTAATFYYGHNYRGTDIARFFRLAAQVGATLRPEEAWVERQFHQARSLLPEGQEIVMLSIAAPDARMEPSWRATILRHELGHGLFGTTPAYAAHIHRVWRERFTEAERAAFRDFLGREGYDTGIEQLMVDETQAYLLHTPDPRFFNAMHVGMTEAEVARLRGLLREGAPVHLP